MGEEAAEENARTSRKAMLGMQKNQTGIIILVRSFIDFEQEELCRERRRSSQVEYCGVVEKLENEVLVRLIG